MVLDPIPQSLPVHCLGSRPQPPTSPRTAPTGTHEVSQILSRRLNTWQKIHRTTLEGGWYRFVNSVSYTHDSFVFFLWGEDRHMKRGSTRQTRGATEHKRGATEEKRGATTQELQQHKRELQQDKREMTWAAERTSGRYHSMKWVSNTHSSSNHLEPPNPPNTIILSPTMEAVWQLRPFGANFETTRYQKKGPFVESLSRLTCVCDWVWAFYVKEFNVHECMRHFMWMNSPSHYRGVPAYMNACGHFLWMNSLYLNECSILSIRNDHMHSYGQIRCIWMDAAFYVNEFLGSLSRRTCVYVCMHIRWIRSLEYGCMRWIHSLKYGCMPHEKLLGITWVSNPATRKDLAARTYGVFWY